MAFPIKRKIRDNNHFDLLWFLPKRKYKTIIRTCLNIEKGFRKKLTLRLAKHFFPLIRLTSPFYLKLFFTSGFIGKRNMNLLIYVNIYGFLRRNKILITTCKTTIKMLNSVWNFTWLKIKLCNKKEEEINMSSFLSEYPDQQCHASMAQSAKI